MTVKTTRLSALDYVTQKLEELVRSGELRRGARLPSEPRLAAMLGVSRASLREATKTLVCLGLLKARAGDGTYLQPTLGSMVSKHLKWMLLVDEVKYAEVYELREVLEPAVAEFAALRATPQDVEMMRTALNGMKSAVQFPDEFIRHEMSFHQAITRASKNRAIESVMQMMYGALTEGRQRVLPLVTDLKRHCERHEQIFRLIAAGQSTRARRAVSADVRYAERLLERSLKETVSSAPTPIDEKKTKRRAAASKKSDAGSVKQPKTKPAR
jgi:DNA-binding FadR family transcriptional regulator